MNISGRGILLTLAIVIAGFTVITIRGQMEEAPAPAQQSVRVMVAKRDLPVGTFVQGTQDLDWQLMETPAVQPVVPVEGQVDESAPQPQAVAQEPLFLESAVRLEDFNGAVVRRALKAGEPVSQTSLMKAGEGGFMSAVLEPGMRAVSVAVNAQTGNAGFLSPGDRVDLIVTHRFKHSNGVDESVVSETFVQDLRVVAVDQMLDNPENKAILAKTVTIECNPHQAEQIAVAMEMGKISFTLRSMVREQKKDPPAEEKTVAEVAPENKAPIEELYGSAKERSFTRDSDLSRLLERRVLSVPRVQVIRGEKTETIDFTLSQP